MTNKKCEEMSMFNTRMCAKDSRKKSKLSAIAIWTPTIPTSTRIQLARVIGRDAATFGAYI